MIQLSRFIVVTGLLCCMLVGCFGEQTGEKQSSQQKDRVIKSDNEKEKLMSKDVKDLVDILNDWDSEELRYALNPKLAERDNFIVSGETEAWLHEHRQALNSMGFSISWDKASSSVIAKPKMK